MTGEGTAPELPYDENTPPTWAEAVNSWEWVPITDDKGRAIAWDKRGPCPRCAHTMSIHRGLVFGVNPVAAEPARCNCAVKHADGRTGCGQTDFVEDP